MAKYKVGDKVIVTGNNSPLHGLNIGEAYTIEELLGERKSGSDYAYSINGKIIYGSDLRSIKTKQMYKKGDKVEIIGNGNYHGYSNGDIVTIDYKHDEVDVYRTEEDYGNGNVRGVDIKPVEELPIPRMVMVKDGKQDSWKEHMLYHILPDCFGGRYITSSNFSDNPIPWELMKEIEEKPAPTELTMEQLQEKLGFEVKIIK